MFNGDVAGQARQRIGFKAEARATQKRPDAGEELIHLKGFREVIIRALLKARDLVRGARLGGQKHHRDVPQENVGLDLPADVIAAHLGHADIQEHQIGRLLAELLNRFLAVMGHDDVILNALEGLPEHGHHGVFIIGNQDNGFGIRLHARIAYLW